MKDFLPKLVVAIIVGIIVYYVFSFHKSCGGIMVNLNSCPIGFTCKNRSNYPDAAGKCIFDLPSIFYK